MGHRHLNSSQIIETENDQDWNHDEQSYIHLARASLPEGTTFVHPAGNSGTFASQWNSAPVAPGYSSSGLHVEIPHYPPQAPASSHDPFLHLSAASFHLVQENYAHNASSSHHGGQIHGVDGGGVDFTMGNIRGPYKRKSPGVPAVCERGGASRYYDAGSSSGIPMPIDSWKEKQISDSHGTPRGVPPSYRGHSLTIRGEDIQRNVRSRAEFDMEANLTRTHLSINPSHNAITGVPTDHSSSMNTWGQPSSASTRDWNHSLISPAHSRNLVSENNAFGHWINHFNIVNGTPSATLDIAGYQNDYSLSQNPVSQNLQGNLSQSVRGVRSSYAQRSAPTFRASISNLRPGPVAPPDEGLPLAAESYSARRPFSTVILRDRHGRNRIPNDRYRSFPDEAILRDRFPPEGLMVVDRSALYGSRTLFDQHRDMRLDIDSMSYEELLALGERIGTVSTGVADDLICRCLTESIFCSSDQSQDEGSCVICLEEYKNMDDVGTLKVCGHDFHVGCIRKWLSMKNLCPICKATALDDKMKQN